MQEETEAFLAIWYEDQVTSVIETKSTKKKTVLDQISIHLHDIGFPTRTLLEIKNKVQDYQELTKAYKRLQIK